MVGVVVALVLCVVVGVVVAVVVCVFVGVLDCEVDGVVVNEAVALDVNVVVSVTVAVEDALVVRVVVPLDVGEDVALIVWVVVAVVVALVVFVDVTVDVGVVNAQSMNEPSLAESTIRERTAAAELQVWLASTPPTAATNPSTFRSSISESSPENVAYIEFKPASALSLL